MLFANTANNILHQAEQGKIDNIFEDMEEKSDGLGNYGLNEPQF
jgi:hypothetical protein